MVGDGDRGNGQSSVKHQAFVTSMNFMRGSSQHFEAV